MADIDLSARVDRLEAIEEIKQLKARYFRLLDTHRWDELRALFDDDAIFDIPESRSQPAGPDAFVQAVRAHLDGGISVHHGHMPEVEVLSPITARATWAMQDLVEPAADTRRPVLAGSGHYVEDYRKQDGQWRITSLRLTRLRRSLDGVAEGPCG